MAFRSPLALISSESENTRLHPPGTATQPALGYLIVSLVFLEPECRYALFPDAWAPRAAASRGFSCKDDNCCMYIPPEPKHLLSACLPACNSKQSQPHRAFEIKQTL